MNRYLWLLCGVVLAGSVRAEEEGAAVPTAAGAKAPAPTGVAPSKGDPGCPPCQVKMCVPETSKSKTARVYYECECKEYCLPKCPFPCFFRKKCGCDDCKPGCPRCDKPRVRNVLIKKLATEETESVRCVLKTVEAPPCAPDCPPVCDGPVKP
jgi:hypothetical protein